MLLPQPLGPDDGDELVVGYRKVHAGQSLDLLAAVAGESLADVFDLDAHDPTPAPPGLPAGPREELLVQELPPIHLVARLQKLYGLHLLDHRVQSPRGQARRVVLGRVYGFERRERVLL